MESPETTQLVEIGLSYRYVQTHGWVVNAVSGWLSAYYMEEPRFRVSRRDQEMETGMHVWVCEVGGDKVIKRLLMRLQADLPPFHSRQQSQSDGRLRYVLDMPEPQNR